MASGSHFSIVEVSPDICFSLVVDWGCAYNMSGVCVCVCGCVWVCVGVGVCVCSRVSICMCVWIYT